MVATSALSSVLDLVVLVVMLHVTVQLLFTYSILREYLHRGTVVLEKTLMEIFFIVSI